MQKIKVYATSDNGTGFVQPIGVYDELEDIEIRIKMFSPDTVITFEYEE